ncbi:uncharacterized protein LOC126958073 isoform X11 [Macaca thibetana thibetana]|uniref:uncharacterized protein LOC126958073 isoform X11 n=1 Tax=Macaca thibetana thibetana TaxID=257877 RepID=UPI0021BCF83A|nr:uncharacterized protein LOC126958073 isoform X11 [Macaca thibetana thibetana]
MPSDSFCLAAQARLDSKWLKTDTQFRACGQRRGGARQSGISSDTVFRLRLPAQGLAIRILKPKKKHRRKKKLMNRKRMPQRFTEAGLHWIKTLLIRGSVSLLANSVCLWFSSCNSFLAGQSPYRELNEAQKKAQGTGRTSAGKRLLDPVLPLTCWGSSRKLLPLCGLSFLRWSFALVAQAGVQCCNLTLPQPPPPRFK